jgi:hypothetical protein
LWNTGKKLTSETTITPTVAAPDLTTASTNIINITGSKPKHQADGDEYNYSADVLTIDEVLQCLMFNHFILLLFIISTDPKESKAAIRH